MKWPESLITGRFVKRYKRFFVDCRLENGQEVTAHCANTGSMRTCLCPGAMVWLSENQNPKRKLRYTLYAVQMADGWVGVHTGLANFLVKEAIENGVFPSLIPSGDVQTEISISKGTRLDLFFKDKDGNSVYVEVKNTTLLLSDGIIAFPDSVTLRGRKHLHEMMQLRASGARAVMVFCVQRESALKMEPSWQDDPEYAETLVRAHEAGVEILACRADFSIQDIGLGQVIPVDLTP